MDLQQLYIYFKGYIKHPFLLLMFLFKYHKSANIELLCYGSDCCVLLKISLTICMAKIKPLSHESGILTAFPQR